MLEGIMLRLIYAAHFLHSDTKCVAQTQEVRSCSPHRCKHSGGERTIEAVVVSATLTVSDKTLSPSVDTFSSILHFLLYITAQPSVVQITPL